MKGEWCSCESRVKRSWLKRCLIRLLMEILNFSREERREHGWQISCAVRCRQRWGFSGAKTFIHGRVEFFG